MNTTQPTIHDLMKAVREHPDYVFGTVFTREDFAGDIPWDFSPSRAEDALVERGNAYIEG